LLTSSEVGSSLVRCATARTSPTQPQADSAHRVTTCAHMAARASARSAADRADRAVRWTARKLCFCCVTSTAHSLPDRLGALAALIAARAPTRRYWQLSPRNCRSCRRRCRPPESAVCGSPLTECRYGLVNGSTPRSARCSLASVVNLLEVPLSHQ
jgi:hypothetical protein